MENVRNPWKEPALALAVAAAAAVAVLLAASMAAGPDFDSALGAGKANILPPDTVNAPFTMVFYSDPHTNHDFHRKLCKSMLAFGPDLAVMGGDCVFDGTSTRQWAGFLIASRSLRTAVPMLAVKGNHDRGGIFERVFDSPSGKTFYSEEFGSVRFLVLDTEMPAGDGSDQFEWLERELSGQRNKPFTIVAMHKPPMSSGEYFVNSGKGELAHLPPLFAARGVDLVLSGHEHFYERLELGGVTYVVADSGGGGLRSESAPHPSRRVFSASRNFCVLLFGESGVVASVFDDNMAPVDFFTVPFQADKP